MDAVQSSSETLKKIEAHPYRSVRQDQWHGRSTSVDAFTFGRVSLTFFSAGTAWARQRYTAYTHILRTYTLDTCYGIGEQFRF